MPQIAAVLLLLSCVMMLCQKFWASQVTFDSVVYFKNKEDADLFVYLAKRVSAHCLYLTVSHPTYAGITKPNILALPKMSFFRKISTEIEFHSIKAMMVIELINLQGNTV